MVVVVVIIHSNSSKKMNLLIPLLCIASIYNAYVYIGFLDIICFYSPLCLIFDFLYIFLLSLFFSNSPKR